MAKEAKKEKQPKTKSYFFYGFNVKLQSDKRHGSNAYLTLINDLYKIEEPIKLIGDRVITMRSLGTGSKENQNSDETFLIGEVVSFTNLYEGHWYNKLTKELQNQELPENLFPNVKRTQFLFVPAAHRVFIKTNSEITLSSMIKFFSTGLNKVIDKDESILIDIIQSKDGINEIISAQEVNSLHVSISYTNEDIGDKATEDMDKLLKDANIGEGEFNLTPNNKRKLDANSDFIKGVLGLAKENGSAVATIKDNNGKKRIIRTKDYPEKIHLIIDKTKDAFFELYKRTIDVYRNSGNKKNDIKHL